MEGEEETMVIPSLKLTAGQGAQKEARTNNYRQALQELDGNAQRKKNTGKATNERKPARVKVYQHDLFSPPTNDPESNAERYDAHDDSQQRNRYTDESDRASKGGGKVVRSMKHSPVQFSYPMYFGEDSTGLRDSTSTTSDKEQEVQQQDMGDDRAVELVGSPFVDAQSFLSESSQLSYSYSDSGTGTPTPEEAHRAKGEATERGGQFSESSPTTEASRHSPEVGASSDNYFSPKQHRMHLKAHDDTSSSLSATRELSNPLAARCLSFGQTWRPGQGHPYTSGEQFYSKAQLYHQSCASKYLQENDEPEEIEVVEEPDLSDSWKEHTSTQSQAKESKSADALFQEYSREHGSYTCSSQWENLEEPSEAIVDIDLKTTKLLSNERPEEEETADVLVTEEGATKVEEEGADTCMQSQEVRKSQRASTDSGATSVSQGSIQAGDIFTTSYDANDFSATGQGYNARSGGNQDGSFTGYKKREYSETVNPGRREIDELLVSVGTGFEQRVGVVHRSVTITDWRVFSCSIPKCTATQNPAITDALLQSLNLKRTLPGGCL
eukprot:gb/GECG01004831.1/.p1 GENE.gb/GECG01004831.1/~~gb/GECG01004831.1/.p1  ORF type:complete len:554 (+),score=89.46 gb/GECG01004831.1/:1-1662(+)